MATVLDINAYGQADIVEERATYPAEFLSWLQNEEERARDDRLNEQRATALDFYNGEPFGDEEEGRSQIVTRDVAEVVDYMVPSVLRTMVSGDRVVEFEALDSGFKEVLEEATEAVSQQFMQEQSGWRILHDALKAGLLEKTNTIKSYVEEKRTRREREVMAEELVLLQEQGLELIEAEPLDELETMWRVAWIETAPKFIDTPIPNEEFLVAPDARCLEEAIYYAHRTPKTLSDLREMGFDVSQVTWDDGSYGETDLRRARERYQEDQTDTIWRDGPTRKVWLLEEYARYDLNGDGIAELLLVHRVGTTILSVTELEYGPCEEWCPFPMQHRRVGQSLADKVMDIQRIRSVLMRQAFDNLYMSNAPRVSISEDSLSANTIDDLLTVRPGGLIRYKGISKPEPWSIPFVAGEAFTAMEVMTGERESRTGITRLNQGLDADALNKTATGTALLQAQGQQIEEYIARNFAEFIGRVFEKKYRLMRDYGKPFTILIDGQPKQVNPSQWPDEMRVVVRVGLGSGRKEQRIQHRMVLLGIQQQAMQAGLPNVGPEQIYNSIKGLTADLQLGQATDYFLDPVTLPKQPEKPDPKMAEAEAKAMLEAEKLQMREREAEREFALKRQQQADDNALKARQQEFDLEAKRERNILDAQLAQAKADDERNLAWAKFEEEKALARERMEFEKEQQRQKTANENALPTNRPGGDLAE